MSLDKALSKSFGQAFTKAWKALFPPTNRKLLSHRLNLVRKIFARMSKQSRPTSRELAQKSLDQGDATGWFEKLYANATTQGDGVPWAKMTPNRHLVQWLNKHHRPSSGQTALVIGCGLGDDAELLAEFGYQVTAFDVAPSAINLCQERFPNTSVNYTVADLLDPPQDWLGKFDFVYESLTVQSLPPDIQVEAMQSLTRLIKADGQLLVMTWLRPKHTPRQGPPWLLIEDDLGHYVRNGLLLAKSHKTQISPFSTHFTGLYVPKMV